jgi:hypothetical protein
VAVVPAWTVFVGVENIGELPDTESISNCKALEVPPPCTGFCTVTGTIPALARSLAGTWAVSCVALTNCVVSSDDPQYVAAPAVKFDPLTFSVNVAPPAEAIAGERPLMTGEIGLTVMLT